MSLEPIGGDAELYCEPVDNRTDHIGGSSTPAGVDGRDDTLPMEQNRDAVGRPYDQTQTGLPGHEGVATADTTGTCKGAIGLRGD